MVLQYATLYGGGSSVVHYEQSSVVDIVILMNRFRS